MIHCALFTDPLLRFRVWYRGFTHTLPLIGHRSLNSPSGAQVTISPSGYDIPAAPTQPLSTAGLFSWLTNSPVLYLFICLLSPILIHELSPPPAAWGP